MKEKQDRDNSVCLHGYAWVSACACMCECVGVHVHVWMDVSAGCTNSKKMTENKRKERREQERRGELNPNVMFETVLKLLTGTEKAESYGLCD